MRETGQIIFEHSVLHEEHQLFSNRRDIENLPLEMIEEDKDFKINFNKRNDIELRNLNNFIEEELKL